LESVLETDNLEEFLANAALAGRQFEAKKEHLMVLDENGLESNLVELPGVAPGAAAPAFTFQQLQVPRRPAWDPGMTKEELEQLEKESFLEWRRGIAHHEEELAAGGLTRATPFEKNLEVWRQLWRVMERSDAIVQIVDSRNPLFYYTHDLEILASELSPPRQYIVLVNKADYLTARQRLVWLRYFKGKGINVIFFSAQEQQEKLNVRARAARGSPEDEELVRAWDEEKASAAPPPPTAEDDPATTEEHQSRLLEREELFRWLGDFVERTEEGAGAARRPRAVVGMVGYPNVGKSSVINVLARVTPFSHGAVRVGVAATPGKTKHFQTINLDPLPPGAALGGGGEEEGAAPLTPGAGVPLLRAHGRGRDDLRGRKAINPDARPSPALSLPAGAGAAAGSKP
ncbi:unnamed protein product, partial [Heterosigma akashiwo]